jgi:hypothetical protein
MTSQEFQTRMTSRLSAPHISESVALIPFRLAMKRDTLLVGLSQLVTLLGAFSEGAYGFLPTISSSRRVWSSAPVRKDEPLGLSAMRDGDDTAGPTFDSSNTRRRRILQSTLATVVTTMATTLPLVAHASLLEEFGTDPKSIQSRKPPPAAAATAEAPPAKAVAIDPTLRGCK